MTQQAKRLVRDQQLPPATARAVHGLSHAVTDQESYAIYPVPRKAGIAYGTSSLSPSDLDTALATSMGSTAWTIQNVTLSDLDESESSDTYVGSPISAMGERPRGLYRTLTGLPQHYQSSLTKRLSRQASTQHPAYVAAIHMLDASFLFSSVYASSGTSVSVFAWDDQIETTDYYGIQKLLGGPLSIQPSLIQGAESVAQVIRDAPVFSRNADTRELAGQLLQLDRDIQEEEDPECPGISVPSLKAFLSFQNAHEDLVLPIVSATPDCNIYATWKADHNRLFSIHFLRDDNVRFVIFRPNEKHADRTVRISGTATADVVFDIAASHGVRGWACK